MAEGETDHRSLCNTVRFLLERPMTDLTAFNRYCQVIYSHSSCCRKNLSRTRPSNRKVSQLGFVHSHSTHCSLQDKPDQIRKLALRDFFQRARFRFLRLLVLLKWTKHVPTVKKSWVRKQHSCTSIIKGALARKYLNFYKIKPPLCETLQIAFFG